MRLSKRLVKAVWWEVLDPTYWCMVLGPVPLVGRIVSRGVFRAVNNAQRRILSSQPVQFGSVIHTVDFFGLSHPGVWDSCDSSTDLQTGLLGTPYPHCQTPGLGA